MALVGLLCWAFANRLPRFGVHALIAGSVGATGLLIYESGAAVGQYGTVFVWATLISSYFFPRRIAAVHFAWLQAVNAATLVLVESTAGYSPLTRWLFTFISLGVVMLLVTEIVERPGPLRQARPALLRALPRHALHDGHRRPLPRGQRRLDPPPRLLRRGAAGTSLLELTHPEDHERALAEALSLFKTGSSAGLETRVRAKDGSWHWLRTSSTLAKDEGLVYARSTDVTQLKLIEAERERLLGEVQDLARHDALTGLPNRRVLQELLPKEMARARRDELPLCLAIVDIDHFKAYNDSHGHLAGDEVLRVCAREWDGALRGEDTLVRFGGEEFLVLLPDTEPEQAAEIVERLRGTTPMEQTCSAGLALWDRAESIDDLLRRADEALYLAKASGRNQLAQAQLAA